MADRTVYGPLMVVTNLQNVPENVCGHKSLQFSTTPEIHTIRGAQTLMDLQYLKYAMYSTVIGIGTVGFNVPSTHCGSFRRQSSQATSYWNLQNNI